ncbi:hypothetical protein [Sediminihabitans luteus]|nr:hypothetical protein [Sediminihabitans luteus]
MKQMLAGAGRYGYNRGSGAEAEIAAGLIDRFASAAGTFIPGAEMLAQRLALETVGSRYPLAVDAAWAVALHLPDHQANMFVRAMGAQKLVALATYFTDEFPGRAQESLLGKRTRLWRGPAAIAAVLLMTDAQQPGFR